jgi:hypothetical protein
MCHRRSNRYAALILVFVACLVQLASGQQSINMPGVENSAGFLTSGTSIEPRTTSESSPMIHRSLGNWTFMFHANAFLADIQQSGPRGHDKLFSTNWLMPMVTRQFGRQTLTFRTMLSLEPATITKRRYPLLLQTGETAYGTSIIDGQHPHDFLMELTGRYDFKVTDGSQVFVYGGPVGEAALGPPGFPHRASASENPVAVFGHHQQDATHIATNVITLGFTQGPLQVEASTFHGREPDENRWNFNRGKPDSFATRLSIAPHRTLSAQFSTGRINNPEALDPTLDTVRTTASVHHNLEFTDGHISSSFIWGRNKDLKNGARRVFNSYNFEVTSKFRKYNWIWARIENVDRDRSLLPVQAQPAPPCVLCGIGAFRLSLLDDVPQTVRSNHVVLGPDGKPVTIEEDPIGRVQAYTVGYERELPISPSWLNVGIGIQATTYGLPARLKAIYGNQPSTAIVFLRLRPRGNMAEHMKQMHRQ